MIYNLTQRIHTCTYKFEPIKPILTYAVNININPFPSENEIYVFNRTDSDKNNIKESQFICKVFFSFKENGRFTEKKSQTDFDYEMSIKLIFTMRTFRISMKLKFLMRTYKLLFQFKIYCFHEIWPLNQWNLILMLFFC